MEEQVKALFNIIRQKYEPAEETDADVLLTTNEIIEKILDFTGKGIQPADVFKYMTDSGFTFNCDSEVNFKWLLKTVL